MRSFGLSVRNTTWRSNAHASASGAEGYRSKSFRQGICRRSERSEEARLPPAKRANEPRDSPPGLAQRPLRPQSPATRSEAFESFDKKLGPCAMFKRDRQ